MTLLESLNRHLTAIRQRDLDTLISTLSTREEPAVIFPNGHLIKGTEAVVDFHRSWFSDPDWGFEPHIESILERQDSALVSLRVRNTDKDLQGRDVEFETWLTLFFTLENDEWKVTFDQNTLLPAEK